MDRDDSPVGRVLGRREVLALLGGTGVALLAECAPVAAPISSATRQAVASLTAPRAASATASTTAPSCVVVPELTEGPYFVDEKLGRSDIRSEPSTGALRPGAALALTFNVSRVSGASCAALAGATVDLWQCDALGTYSDAQDQSFNTKGQKFLRGYQLTDAAGRARFVTIYPGWYQGRAVHIHFKIRIPGAAGRAAEFTSQLFFDEALTDLVFAQAPYAQKGQGRTHNASDAIFRAAGDALVLKVARSGDGYAATFDLGVAG